MKGVAFRVDLAAQGNLVRSEAIVRLRQALKVLLRRFGLRCTRIVEICDG